jgi:hypothetical protein
MGLDAAVPCTCFQQGRIVSPFPDHTIMDEEGQLTLDFPLRGHEEEYDIFEEWLHHGTVCEHPGMKYCKVHLSNWGGVRSFQAALEEAGWDHFPTLRAYLPEHNGGRLPASLAEAALEELKTFRGIYTGTVPVLVNAETGTLEREHGFAIYGGRSQDHSEYVVGMDRDGVYVGVPSRPPQISFRSQYFEQRLTSQQEDVLLLGTYKVVLRDLVTGETCVSPRAVTKVLKSCTMRVGRRTQRADRFTSILEPLEQILLAAVETGNPVGWY